MPPRAIYNSRNYSILLNIDYFSNIIQSTTVEIILYYLTGTGVATNLAIYNSRNYSILLNCKYQVNDASYLQQ